MSRHIIISLEHQQSVDMTSLHSPTLPLSRVLLTVIALLALSNVQMSGNWGIIGTSFFILLHLDRQGMLMIYIVGAILFLLQLCEGRGETRALKA